MKKYLHVLLILVMIFGIQTVSHAETVNASLSIPFNESPHDWASFDGLGTKEIYVYDWNGYIGINLSKVFNFSKNDGSTLTLNSTLDIGEKINPHVSNTEGNYSVEGDVFNINQSAMFNGKNCWIKMCF
jgi:hypothetical protein